MTTILFHYIHRDEGNWKDHLEAAIDNPNNLPLDEIEETRSRTDFVCMIEELVERLERAKPDQMRAQFQKQI